MIGIIFFKLRKCTQKNPYLEVLVKKIYNEKDYKNIQQRCWRGIMRNIIFDLGRVLLNFEPIKYLQTLYPPEKVQMLHENIFLSKEWLDLDRGIITNEEAIRIITKRCPDDEKDIKNVINNWPQILTPIEGSIKILAALKRQGYPLYLLSNFHKEAFNQVLEKYAFFKSFDGKVVSYQVSLLKPEKEIYVHLCNKYNLKAETSLFIDDTLANIHAAKKLGFETIQFKNSKQLSQKLNHMKIIDADNFNM